MNPLKKLSRLFRSNPNNNFLAELYSKTFKPLFVHPQVGKAMLDSYLVMAKQNVNLMGQERDEGSGSSVFITKHEGVAVMDISGSLTDREMSVPCMASPVSYEAIKFEMETLLADQEVHTIVARLDSPGGVANQNMDLSDFIYSSRGQGTKLIASVDDMAYSAAFGIASAFEEVWITRTGGVGSVGVVSYHEDHSRALAKKGVKVEYIYAGDKKVFGNPAEPLTDEARQDYQLEVSRLYNIFTATVARNLNMSVDAVKATQAGTFHGQNAVDVGFAHRLGTFDDLMQELFSDGDSIHIKTDEPVVDLEKQDILPEQNDGEPGDEDPVLSDLIEEEHNAVKSVETELIVEQNQEDIITEQEQKALNTYTASVTALCMVAGVDQEITDTYLKAKMSIDEVRDNLLIITDNSSKQIVTGKTLNRVDNNQEQIDNGWDNAFKNV